MVASQSLGFNLLWPTLALGKATHQVRVPTGHLDRPPWDPPILVRPWQAGQLSPGSSSTFSRGMSSSRYGSGPWAGPPPARSGAANRSPGKCKELLRPHFWWQLWRAVDKHETRSHSTQGGWGKARKSYEPRQHMAAPASQEKAALTTKASAEFFWGHLPSAVTLPRGHKRSRQVRELPYDTLCPRSGSAFP